MTLAGRVALVTGAGRGIGRAISLALGAAGVDLALLARSEDELEQTTGAVRLQGRTALPLLADVAQRETVQAAVEMALSRFGRIDILINNAGVQPPIGPLVDNDPDQWERAVAVNLFGTFHCLKAVLPGMIERRQGKIINLSGGGATAPRPNFSAYAASKAAVVRLTETLAEELQAYNIQVNAIAPGAINTRMLDEVLAAGDAAGDELTSARKRSRQGGTPVELAADLVVFLASEKSGSLTGKLISAPHDDWQVWDDRRVEELAASPWYTLRRLDPHTVGSLLEQIK